MRKLFFSLMFLVFALPAGTSAEAWTPKNFPITHFQDAQKYVSDPDNILSDSARASVDHLLYNLEQKTGVQTLVAVANQVENEDCYQFGMDLAQKYGVGSKKQRTGLVIVLAKADRCYYILTGNGLEGSLPDAICKRIENYYLVPKLKANDWDGAALDATKAICAYLEKDNSLLPEKVSSANGDDNSSIIALVITLFIILFLYVIYKVSANKSTRCPKCHSHELYPTDETVTRTSDGAIMVVYRCKRCGYTELRKKRDDDDDNGGLLTTTLFGLGSLGGFGGFGGFRGGGGGGGGSFGGGSFGGGGAGGKF